MWWSGGSGTQAVPVWSSSPQHQSGPLAGPGLTCDQHYRTRTFPPSVMAKDYYSVLEVRPTASLEEIKKAYKRKALQFHPDKNDAPEAEERFKQIAEAYEVLSDCDRKQKYDAHQPGAPTRYHFSSTRDPFDLFKTFFNGRDPFADIFSSVFTAGELNRSSSARLSPSQSSSAKTTVEEHQRHQN